uniref:Threonine aspartase 1-like n=1 Tax=Actinia tenebrosa TaxID=6105 RepID=A0A6P8GZ82_ACTTE
MVVMATQEILDKPYGFIGVHVGVGKYSSTNEADYKDACRTACLQAVAALKEGKLAVEAVAVALSALEDAPCPNAGVGSNLNLEGEVECDASIMDGKSLGFGAVGAVKGIKNPSQVAAHLLKKELQGPTSVGLIPPIFLVGDGAVRWANQNSVAESVSNESLITDKSLAAYNKSKAKLDRTRLNTVIHNSHKKRRIEDLCVYEDSYMDTVGVVCVDSEGNLCAGVSSGGLLLKTPGRVGQAAVYGSGCWARNKTEESDVGVACCTTGCGEYLIKTILAKECAEMASNRDGYSAVKDALQQKFFDAPHLLSNKQKIAGILLLRAMESSQGREVELVWGHNASSMCLGYMSTENERPKIRICRSFECVDVQETHPVTIEGTVERQNKQKPS